MNRTALAKKITRFLKEEEEALFRLLRRMVETESPSLEPERQAGMFELLHQFLRSVEYEVFLLPPRRSGGEIYARPRIRTRGAPFQVLLGHVDTVWPVGTLEQMPYREEGNVIRGPGVYDMKVGLTQALFALKALHAVGFDPDVTPVLYASSDEELGSEDSRHHIQLLARRACRVFVMEPSTGEEGHLKTSRKGVGLFKIEIRGRSAHAGVEPESGVSAVLELAKIIQDLDRLNDPKLGISVTVGVVSGGSRANMVPAYAEAEVDVRVETTEQGDEIEQRIRRLQPSTSEVQIRVTGGMDRPPLEKSPRNRRLWEQAQKAAGYLGLEIQESRSGGGSDGNLTSPFTATLDGLGGVGGGAHAVHEFILRDRVLERTALLAMLLAEPAR